ncbi:hypothetical protein [Pseudobutyrivibrio ruminis]|uniref:Uncharacterized protein n=1 Tax=Pseudobutyrivibrio ruminis TaxID=46206 RepID=A0A2G3DS39_9FIRM|nr:hypothetical protein [Pseudobutyrivibrio ruminis]PHU33852.1 hypothetical protein CSX01_13120 [Pseudobutyrivibrio ruminis]
MSEYAIYNNRRFRAVYNDGKVFLTSKKEEEGFELHSFISGFETINTYEKTVSEKEVDAVFYEEIFIRYLLNDYCLFYSPRYEDFIKDNSIRILTTNSELAHTYNFNRSEPGVYYKDILINEIDTIIIKRTPVGINTSSDLCSDAIITKDNVKDYLYGIHEEWKR